MNDEDAQAEAALVAFGHKRPEPRRRRPVLTLHLPLEMGAVGRVLQLAAELWPGAVVGEPTAQGDVVVEAELPHLVEQPQPAPEPTTFTAGAEKWLVPSWAEPPREGERVSSCRSCQAPVLWVRTNTGRAAPINADGTSHFATCPQADAWRRK